MVRDTNNDLFTPTNLGVLTPSNALDGSVFTTSRSDSVSTIDDINDFYTVRLDRNSSLNISLSGLSSGARVDLINNANQSRFGDPGETIQTLTTTGGPASMQIQGLGAAEYGLRVSTSTGTTNYSLNLLATAGAGREQGDTDRPQPQFINVLNGNRLIKGSLNSDSDIQDPYHFRVEVPTKLNASSVTPAGVTPNLSLLSVDPSINVSELSFSRAGLQHDSLPPGDYFITPSSTLTSTDYALQLTGTLVERAELSIFVEQVSTDGDFGLGDAPDFFVRATIDGTDKRTRTFDNRETVNFNETLTQSVDINKALIPFTLHVFDSDGGFRRKNDEGDINEERGTRSLSLVYDIQRQIVSIPRSNGNEPIAVEGDTITVKGNGDDDKATTLKFKVNYNTFGFGQTSFSNNTPTTIGTNSSGVTSGRNAGGIVDGRGGKDEVYAKGGDDFAMGGVGNDYVDGGTGDDLVFGGIGKDTCVGGKGRDTIVLAPGTGVDVIQGFRNDIDKLGLANAIAFEMLDVFQRGRNTVIGLGGERLAVLKGVRANQIGAEDFVAIDFISFKGMEVPTIAAFI